MIQLPLDLSTGRSARPVHNSRSFPESYPINLSQRELRTQESDCDSSLNIPLPMSQNIPGNVPYAEQLLHIDRSLNRTATNSSRFSPGHELPPGLPLQEKQNLINPETDPGHLSPGNGPPPDDLLHGYRNPFHPVTDLNSRLGHEPPPELPLHENQNLVNPKTDPSHFSPGHGPPPEDLLHGYRNPFHPVTDLSSRFGHEPPPGLPLQENQNLVNPKTDPSHFSPGHGPPPEDLLRGHRNPFHPVTNLSSRFGHVPPPRLPLQENQNLVNPKTDPGHFRRGHGSTPEDPLRDNRNPYVSETNLSRFSSKNGSLSGLSSHTDQNLHRHTGRTIEDNEVPSRVNPLKGRTKTKSKKIYKPESMALAIQEIRNGNMSTYKASKEFKIPKSTIQYQLSGKCKQKGRPGPDTVLTSDEELKIIKWIKECQKKAFPVSTEDLKRKIADFLKENPRSNPFRDNKPGRRWLEGLLNRHKDISIRTPEAISKASANVSESDLRKWYAQILEYAHKYDLGDVLEDPSRILSGDETGMPKNVTAKKVLAETGSLNVSATEPSNAKQNITVLFTFSADGHVYPPLVVLPLQRIPKETVQHYPGDWGLGCTESGWMNTANFLGYIKKILCPSLVRRNVNFPVFYFVDGHKSHLSMVVIDACLKLNIILISLYPNATRIIQPCDVGIFGPLKHFWRIAVGRYKDEQGGGFRITPQTFPVILQSAMQQAFKKTTIINAFRPCGIFPFNPDAVDYSKCYGKNQAKDNHDEATRLPAVKSLLRSVEDDTERATSNSSFCGTSGNCQPSGLLEDSAYCNIEPSCSSLSLSSL